MNTLFVLRGCPYCIKALKLIDEAVEQNPDMQRVRDSIHIVDEAVEKALASSYDYFYVPCFYKNKTKIHEGGVSRLKMDEILAEFGRDL